MGVEAAVEEAVGEYGPYPRKKGDASLFVEEKRGNGQRPHVSMYQVE